MAANEVGNHVDTDDPVSPELDSAVCSFRGTPEEIPEVVKKDVIVCLYCSKEFTGSFAKGGLKSNYNRHLLTHSKERPYQCDDCEKGFATSTNLKRHVKRRHPQSYNTVVERFSIRSRSRPQTPLSTEACGGNAFPSLVSDQSNCESNVENLSSTAVEFPVSVFFREDMRPVLPQPKLHQCQSCDRQFVWRTSLLQHINMYHRDVVEQYICDWCQTQMSSRTKLRRHQRYHCPFRDDDADVEDEKNCDSACGSIVTPVPNKLVSPVFYTIKRFPNVADSVRLRASQSCSSAISGVNEETPCDVELASPSLESGRSCLTGVKRHRHVAPRRRSYKNKGVLVNGESNRAIVFPPIQPAIYTCPFDVCKKVFAKQKYLKSHLKRVHKLKCFDAGPIDGGADIIQICDSP